MTHLNQDNVSEVLNSIVKHGYRELVGLPPEQAAIELINCVPEFEDDEIEELLPFIRVWQSSRRK